MVEAEVPLFEASAGRGQHQGKRYVSIQVRPTLIQYECRVSATLTLLQPIRDAHAQIRMAMRIDRHARLPLHVLLIQVDVIVLARIHNLDVELLPVAAHGAVRRRPSVDRDDDQRVAQRVVPDALRAGGGAGGDVELDGRRGGGEEKQREEEQPQEGGGV